MSRWQIHAITREIEVSDTSDVLFIKIATIRDYDDIYKRLKRQIKGIIYPFHPLIEKMIPTITGL